MAAPRSFGALTAARRPGLRRRVRLARDLAASFAARTRVGETGDGSARELGESLVDLMRERPLAPGEARAAVPPLPPGPYDEDAPRVRELAATLLADPGAYVPPLLGDVVRALDATLAELTPQRLADGEQLGAFHIVSELRLGSTGRAVLARRGGETVVLKIAKIGEQDASLRRELEALARIRHPNVVRSRGAHLFERENLYAGEFVRAPGNDGYRRAGLELRSDRIAAIASGLLGALQAVHDAGYLHRDVKPSNFVVDDRGHVTLLDFGLVAPPGDTELVVGSTPFKSPRLLQRGRWTYADDVFGALVSLWHLMTGRHPWSWDKPADLAVLRAGDLFPIFAAQAAERITERFRALLAEPPDGRDAATATRAQLDAVLR